MAQLERRRSAQERYPSLCLRIPTRPSLEFWGWGRNDFGQLGLNDEQPRSTPVHLESLDNKDLVHLAGSSFNSGFLTDDGEVYLSGVNDNGQLAFKSASTRLTPTRVNALETFRITHLSMGVSHSLAVTERGQLLTWGLNDNGQLGYNSSSESSPIPKLVTGVRDLVFVRVAAGSAHSLALTSCGNVYSAGQGTFGALGHGVDEDLMEFKLLRGFFGFGVIQVECGEFHNAALTSEGEVWTWGRGKHGQLGLGTTQNIFLPTQVSTLSPHKIKQIACGDSHTLCVTKDGLVFAWGQSRWGQTGTTSIEDILIPKLLDSLSEEYITQVAAGSRHSAVLALRGVVFVFGNHELGQLGIHEISTFSAVPIPVEGLPGFPVICILAKGDHNLVMFDKTPGSLAGMAANGRYGLGMMPFKVPDLDILLGEVEKNQKSTNEHLVTFLRALDDIFESPGFLLDAFMPPEKTGKRTGLNTVKINEIYGRIFRSYDEKAILQVGIACGKLLTQILETGHTFPEILHDRSDRWIPLILIIMLNPVFGETLASGGEMVVMISAILDFMWSSEKQSLRRYLNELPVEVFGGKVVKGVQKYLTNLAKNHDSINHPISGQKRRDLFKICTLLSLFYEANKDRKEKIQFEHFYNNEVSDGLELITEFINWVTGADMDPKAITSICQFPFILTPDVKAKITYGESLFRKQATMQSNQIEALIHGIHPGQASFLDIRIRRDHLREDAVNQLMHRSEEFQKPLRVTFLSNGVEEEGEDEGGLSKEFFQLLIEEIFNVDFGMFVYNEETRDYWFSSAAFEVDDFYLVGTVLGLAIYNKVILDVHFPLVVYKKLMQLPTSFQDLKTAFPELAKGLQQLLEFEGDVENTFLKTFEIEYELFGEMITEELKPGGASIPVTNDNRTDYVELYTHYILEESIKGPFDEFAKGFWNVCGSQSMTLFRYEELELLICGLPHLDFHELERVTLYDGGYTATSRVIQDFWSVLHELSLKDKKKFLFFVTGCDRAPVGGLSKLKFIIQRSEPDTNRLPTSHTCFNVLLLPEYNSKEKLKDRLMVAIHNSQGFGLQ